MSAEWQAKQLLLTASALALPGNRLPPAGRSTVVDEGRQILNLGAQRGRPRLLYPGSDTTSLLSRKKQS
jgi:hypothetical protein